MAGIDDYKIARKSLSNKLGSLAKSVQGFDQAMPEHLENCSDALRDYNLDDYSDLAVLRSYRNRVREWADAICHRVEVLYDEVVGQAIEDGRLGR